MQVPTRPSMRRPPAGSTKASRSVSDFRRHRPHRADQAERDVNDITAGRQHDVRGRAAILADQLERAGLVRLVGKHPPHQPAIDDRQILAVARGQRQHRLVRSWRARRRVRPAEPWRSTAADGGLVQRRGQSSGSTPGRTAAPDSSQVRSGHPEPGRRHRRRPVAEHLGRGRGRQQRDQRHGKRQRRERPASPPVFHDAIAP